MRTLIYSFSMVCLFVSCGTEDSDSEKDNNKDTVVQTTQVAEVEEEVVNSFFIESGIVGVFKIGQPFPKLPEGLSSRRSFTTITEDGESVEHLTYVIFNSLEDIAEVVVEKNDAIDEEDLVITQMKVISNYYETKEGVKIGVNLKTLIEKHPKTKIHYDGTTGEIVAETSDYIGTQFILDPKSCTKKLSGKGKITLSKSNFKDDAKIIIIRVF